MGNPIKLAILHGSRATGRAHKNSDWDVAVLAEKKLDGDSLWDLKKSLANKLNAEAENIDIADLRVASPLLQFHVAKKGKLILGNEFDFLKFKIFAWKHYLETKKFRKIREHYVLEN